MLYRFYSETGGRVGCVQVDAAIATPQFDDAMERLVDLFGLRQQTPAAHLLLMSPSHLAGDAAASTSAPLPSGVPLADATTAASPRPIRAEATRGTLRAP